MARSFRFPDVGEGITEGEVVRWLVAEGEPVKVDQPLVEIETDKAVVELPSPFAGTILKLHAAPREVIKVGAALVTMVLTGGSVKYLVVLYSINVFITFFLSQLGMVRHWWQVRGEADHWEKKLFINGVQEASANSRFIRQSSGGLAIGRKGDVAAGAEGGYLGGLIDDVRIYNRALSASEIVAVYNGPASTP